MIMTPEIIKQATSSLGGLSRKQFELLGVKIEPPMLIPSGWRKEVIGRIYPDEVVKEFIALKDAHLTPAKIKYGLDRKLKKAESNGK
jgi:hypothetical protein